MHWVRSIVCGGFFFVVVEINFNIQREFRYEGPRSSANRQFGCLGRFRSSGRNGLAWLGQRTTSAADCRHRL
jgi:hypothetical protein